MDHKQARGGPNRGTRVKYPFTVRPLSDEDGGGYVVEFPDLPGCMADGASPEEAIREGRDALQSWIKTMKALRRPIRMLSRSSDAV